MRLRGGAEGGNPKSGSFVKTCLLCGLDKWWFAGLFEVKQTYSCSRRLLNLKSIRISTRLQCVLAWHDAPQVTLFQIRIPCNAKQRRRMAGWVAWFMIGSLMIFLSSEFDVCDGDISNIKMSRGTIETQRIELAVGIKSSCLVNY
jgi:hypothetical protein